VFIDSDSNEPTHARLMSKHTQYDASAHGHETAHAFSRVYDSVWMEEGTAEYVGTRLALQAVAEHPDLLQKFHADNFTDNYNVAWKRLAGWGYDKHLLQQMRDNNVERTIQTNAGFVFLYDLEQVIGEEAMRAGYRELMRDGLTLDKSVYEAFRKHSASGKFQEYDALWETRVFGTERFGRIRGSSPAGSGQ
ncbi:MAG: hypothetical protein AABX69_02655, partial [Nanoarchaeota archaeon]